MKDPRELDRRRLLLAGSAAIISKIVASAAQAQDAVATQPGAFRVVFENDQTRVLEFVSRPRTAVCGVGKHSHPAHLTIALSDAKVRVTLPDGKTVVATNKLGDVFWSEAETHAVENIGGANMRALIVEFKAPPKTRV
jgi:beta-alanine degradation protein BauB